MERRASKTLFLPICAGFQSAWAQSEQSERPVKWREHIIGICLHLLDGVDLRLLNNMGRLERSTFIVGLYIGQVYNLSLISS